MRPFLFFIVTLFASLSLGPRAFAQAPTSEDRAAAQVLFDEGRTLGDAGDWKGACAKFEESMRLHQAVGTQLNLARCYEEIDQLASAWINWVEAKQRATAAGQDKRAKIAGERAAALESRVSFITIRVKEPVEGLVVTRDGTTIGKPQWDTRLPIDGGSHRIEVTAPGYDTWRQKVHIKREGAHVVVRVPALSRAAAAPKPLEIPEPTPLPSPDEPTTPPDTGVSGQLVGGIVLTVLGAGGLAVGIGFGVLASGKNDDSLTHCPDSPSACTPEGVALRDDAFTFAHASTAGFAVGGASLLAGVILIATSFSGGASIEDDAAVRFVPTANGVGLEGRF